MNESRDDLRQRVGGFSSHVSCCTVAYRGGLGGSNTPLKFRRYRWSPRSHEQEEPASRFPFAVHCFLIRL